MRHYVCTGMYVHPVLCCNSMYRYLPDVLRGECRGALAGSPRDSLLFVSTSRSRAVRCRQLTPRTGVPHSPLPSPPPADPDRAPALGDPGRPESRPGGRGKTRIVYRCLIILRNILGPQSAKARPGAADYKILLYVTPKTTRKLISSLLRPVNTFLPQGSRILVVSRPGMYACLYTCALTSVCK